MEAFTLAAEPGRRFALFRPPRTRPARGAVLYVAPFAEELNKSRRMATLQSQAFAAAGFGVLQFDLLGCGDSDGEFDDARWTTWQRDVACAASWLDARGLGPVHLWGLRLGATLALACWKLEPRRFASALLWQPVHDGRAFVTQFLRLSVAREALLGNAVTTDALRGQLADGSVVDVAGYRLAPALIGAIDEQRIADFGFPGASVHWFDLRANPGPASPATLATIASWQNRGVAVQHRTLAGQSFWSTVEITEVPALIEATTAAVAA